MGKKVFYDDDARQRIIAGAEIIYKAVKTTLGPKGRNVVIKKNYGQIITHDGVTVAKNVDLTDDEVTLGYSVGADIVRNASIKMGDLAGDGTTTVTVLTYHILAEANKLITAGYDPMQLRRGLEEAKELVLTELKNMNEEIAADSDKVAQIATISAEDAEIGRIVAEVVKAVGSDGVISVESGQGMELESEIVKGYTFDKGYVSPYFVTDTARMEAVLERPLVLVTDQKLTSNREILPLLEKVAQTGKKELLIIAEDVQGEVLQTLVVNKLKGIFTAVCVKAPSFGDFRKETLQDIAILTGATFITEDHGDTVAEATLEVLGQAKRVLVTQDETTIIEGDGEQEDVELRMTQIEEQAKHADGNYNKDRYKQRAAALKGAVAIIRVGGVTETEIEEKKYRVDDAVAAAKAAVKGGIVAGGGITLLNLSDTLTDDDPGQMLLRKALRKPFAILLENAGLSAEAYVGPLANKVGIGIDVSNPNKTVNLKEAGIVDPTLVTTEAIQNSVSIAGTAMTMGALVVEEPQKETAMPMMPPGAM